MSLYPEEPRRRRDGSGRAVLAAVLAVALHFAFAGLLLFFSLLQLNLPAGKAPPPPRAVTMRPLSNEQWAKNRGPNAPRSRDDDRARASREEPKKPEEKKKPEPKPEGRVVAVAPGNGEEDPNAKNLAETSNKVKKESKSKHQTPFYRNAMPQRTTTVPEKGSGSDNASKQQVAGNNGIGDDDRPLREPGPKKGIFEVPDVQRREEVAMRSDPSSRGPGTPLKNRTESEEVHGNSNRLKIQPGDPGAGDEQTSNGRAGQGVTNLNPSASVLDKVAGAAPSDHLDGVEEGEGTFLNTKEWKYASFYNRVKQSVGMNWHPGQKLRQRDPTGDIYGGRDRYTLLAVTLTDSGRVKDIYVEKSCGIDFLDLEAIHSFERAQPFPNPPAGLAAADSTVHIKFGFFLEMGGGPRLRLFRQGN